MAFLKRLRGSFSGAASERAAAAARRNSCPERRPPSKPTGPEGPLDSSAHSTSSTGSGGSSRGGSGDGSQRSIGSGGGNGWSGPGPEDVLIGTPLPPLIPLRDRKERESFRERRRSVPGGIEEAVAGRDSPNTLRFKDAEGREIRYALRPSLKKSRSTYLEVTAGGTTRKVRRISYDEATRVIRDGKEEFRLPRPEIESVMRKLAVLCKISRTRLDRTDGAGRGLHGSLVMTPAGPSAA